LKKYYLWQRFIKTNMEPIKPDTQGNSPQEERSKENRLLIIVIFILAIMLLLLGWQYWKQKQTTVIIQQIAAAKTDSVTTDLINLQAQYATLKTSDQRIQDEVNSKKDTITMLLQQAEKYKNDPYIIAKLKQETETLRKIMQSYVVTIDSLNTLNKVLTSERNVAVESLKVEKNKTVKLNMEKGQLQNMIHTGSMLAATSIKIEGVHFRFGKKEITTDKAKKAEKIKVSFTITANRIAKAGGKNIYIRVITPDGKELSKSTDESSIFDFEGTKGFYDAMQNIDYANQEVQLVMYCESASGFIPGTYIIKLYADSGEMGEGTLIFK
jgi:hypothetical protein